MIIIPAIDILGSKCVRLSMGDYDRRKEYALTPLEAALRWEKAGAERLHLVDLDGAKSGNPDNFDVIVEIVKNVSIPVEVGGGIRNNESVEKYFEAGVSNIILGSILFSDINSISGSLAKYRGRIIAGLDLNDGRIAVSGWREFINLTFSEAIAKLKKEFGIETYIVTDIKKDGMLSGVNIPLLKEIAALDIDLIASGGVSSVDDIIGINDLKLPNIIGVITGKALYDGRIDLKNAIYVLKEHIKKNILIG